MNLIKKITLVLGLLLSYNLSFGQNVYPHVHTHIYEPAQEPREHLLDIRRMKVEVSFEPAKGIVKGKVTHYFVALRTGVDTVFFDAPGIKIQSITSAKGSCKFVIRPEGVLVYLPATPKLNSPDSLVIAYTATPRKGIYFTGWNATGGLSRKQIWTQGQGIDNRYWIPMYDDPNDKMITETLVRIDAKYSVLSNGTKLGETLHPDNTKTTHYTMTRPHANYLLMLGIGEYAVDKRQTKNGLPVNLWYYPEFPERVRPTYLYSTECIEFLEEQTGIAYPWESYSQIPVQDFMYGAMENTTATIFGDFFFVDARANMDRNYIGVNVHELTHQWFGDLITGRSFKSIWLQESFATYYPKIFTRKYFGNENYDWQRRSEHNGSLAASEKDRMPIIHTLGGSPRWYGKGSAVIEMMNYVFGEEAFRRVIYHYLKKNAYKNVETNDLYQSFQDTLGLSPYWFFDQWLYRGGEPHYKVSYKAISKAGLTQIQVSQIHLTDELTGLFRMPIHFQVHYTDGSHVDTQRWIENKDHLVEIPNAKNKKIAFVLFDPNSHVLKKVTFDKSQAELKAQAAKAANMLDRLDALIGLRSVSMEQKRGFLLERYKRETFSVLKSEIITQLINDNEAASIALLKSALNDKDNQVRKSVVNNLKLIPESLRPAYEVLLEDSSYQICQTVLDKLCYQFPQNRQKYFGLASKSEGMSKSVQIRRLELEYLFDNNTNSLAALIDFAGPNYEFMTRQNAFNAFRRLGYGDAALANHLYEAMYSPNTRLAEPAKDLFRYLVQQRKYKKLFEDTYKSKTYEPWQKALIEPVFN